MIGTDLLSGGLFAHDPFTAYQSGHITSPNVIVLGVIGSGKSSLLKTVYVLRPLLYAGRRVFVLDRKPRDDVGEYTELVERFKGNAIKMRTDEDGTRLNLLDPVIFRGAGPKAQMRLLKAVAEIGREDGTPLDSWEFKALRLARDAALREAERQDRVPVLDYLVPALGAMTSEVRGRPEIADLSKDSLERLHQAGVGLRFLFEEVVLEGLGGMFNGETSTNVRLSERLDSFDLSQLPSDGPAVPIAVAVAQSWLMGMVTYERGRQTNMVGEEGWHLLDGPGAKLVRSNQKLCRALGISNIYAMHHVADVDPRSVGMSIIKEAQTVHIYRQDRAADIDAVIQMYDFDPATRHTLSSLPNGEHLCKIAERPEVRVRHMRSQLESELTDTNEAMIRRGLA
ncbi:MAG: ATP/GTP-binding protein [Micrococcus sp.]|nr:ATP/GTP-binding protein [Micrococcus sp.]